MLVPEHRLGNQWIKSNRFDDPALASPTGAQIFLCINARKNAVEIADLMHRDRFCAWTFRNLYWPRPPSSGVVLPE
jgi:hypothetical protein